MNSLSSIRQPTRPSRPGARWLRGLAAGQARRIRAELAAWWRDDSLAFDWRAALAAIVGGLLLAPLLYGAPLVGLDLNRCFRNPANPCGQMPWVSLAAEWLQRGDWRVELAILNGLMLMTVAVATARQGRDRRGRLLAVALAVVSPPVLMLAWTGQIDGLGLLGLLLMPAGLPLLLTKPQVLGWAVLGRKWWLITALALLLVSFIIWGWWPPHVLKPPGPSRDENPMAMGWSNMGWHVLAAGLVMLFFSSRDPYRLMAAGALVTPYLLPYHMVALLPALGRVDGWRRWALWGAAWLTSAAALYWMYHMFFVPGFDIWAWSAGPEPPFLPVARHLGLLFPVLTWWWLREERAGVKVRV